MKINLSLIPYVVIIGLLTILYVMYNGVPHTLVINGATDSQKDIINEAMQKIDKRVANSIYSVTVSNDLTEQKCYGDIRGVFLGCTEASFNPKGGSVRADIYLANDKYSGCYTFNNTLYHEIGHVAYNYYFGETQDSQVLFGTEMWVNNFANQYAPSC